MVIPISCRLFSIVEQALPKRPVRRARGLIGIQLPQASLALHCLGHTLGQRLEGA